MRLLPIRKTMAAQTLADETEILQQLVALAALSADARMQIATNGANLVRAVRNDSDPTLMENFLGEFGLSTNEGVALMCLAEAMLRIPDAETIDALIADKISSSNWDAHLGRASSSLVNASTWALMLTGRVLSDEEEHGLTGTLHNLIRRAGEPVIRTAVTQAMREMGKQFVLGETIEAGLENGQSQMAKGYTYSFDMLGEAAITQRDAKRYHLAYADAITEIARHARGNIRENPGISVKLSALHPRYERAQKPRMFETLLSRTKSLAMLAMGANIGFNVDAEEAARLDISLDVIEAIVADSSFAGWDGFGVVVQAYSKRAAPVLDWLYTLAKKHDRKIMVRLVKGAYWDTEIKQAQILGLEGYPVFTRKQNTDISYIACARKLLAMREYIYPQFATHNAHSVAAIQYMAGDDYHSFEFQRLHGMGEALMEQVVKGRGARCRIYAPVGAHKDLLAYLVRRLLENGANSSFVHQIVDEGVSPQDIAGDPFLAITDPAQNPAVALPAEIFGTERKNSAGYDVNDPVDIGLIEKGRIRFQDHIWDARPLLATKAAVENERAIHNPAKLVELVGSVRDTSLKDIEHVVTSAKHAQPKWANLPAKKRADILIAAADLYEKHGFEIYALLAREAGKTISDCIGELREAVDFLRYYANETIRLDGTANARGIITCISPWNFPLAIFTGQIAAALGAGNAVLAKPAEQTPLIAFRATQLLHKAGVPRDILQLLPGDGSTVGAALTSHSLVDGVCFTGSTRTARIINKSMAGHLAPDAVLIAETGGLNAMIVDSSALPEQAVRDVIASSFQSAGQRCSACRILYLQADIAGEFLAMLHGAIDCLKVGDPWELDTDVGPLIDRAAFEEISKYADAGGAGTANNYLLEPCIKPVSGIGEMEREIFGPVLHVATFEADQLDQVVDDINAKGYGLTFGLHTRIDARVEQVTGRIKCGNIYINRNQIGAIVGSQPFGGEGLSGTGPKAGGPNYMRRFMRKTKTGKTDPTTRSTTPLSCDNLQAAINSVGNANRSDSRRLSSTETKLPGPTGESNILSYAPKGTILCLGPTLAQAVSQAKLALEAGCPVVAVLESPDKKLNDSQHSDAPIICLTGQVNPADLQAIDQIAGVAIGGGEQMAAIRRALSLREGPIVQLIDETDLLTAFRIERHTCIDTTAAGGNAALMVEAG